jgi:cation:H+ antiporter
MVAWLIWLGRQPHNIDPLETEFTTEIPTDFSNTRALFWTLLGLVILVLSARLLVWGAENIARTFGVSDLVIGLTIIAVGTSLPELAASAMSAFKGEDDMAVGNVIGSNMFNLLAVLALPALIAPSQLDSIVLQRDYPVMIGLTFALFLMAYGFRGPGRLNRLEGGLLLLAFVVYMAWLGSSSLA